MYVYIQRDIGGHYRRLGTGYSGRAEAKNNPRRENDVCKGPIPKGHWKTGKAYRSTRVGAHAIPLERGSDVAVYHRSGFLIHGDSRIHPGQASSGCIVLPLSVRRLIRSNAWLFVGEGRPTA